MTTNTSAVAELREWLATVHDIDKANALLGWDQMTQMPGRGAAVRAQQRATLTAVAHERFTSDHTGRLIEAAEAELAEADRASNDASLVRVNRKDWDRKRRVPNELAAGIALAASEGFGAWKEARASSDFAQFLPALQRMYELKLRYIDCFDVAASPYDVLIEDFEPGMTTADITPLFDLLKQELAPVVARLDPAQAARDARILHGDFPLEQQQRLQHQILQQLGFEETGWRLDTTVHPFASSIATTDIRLTTRYSESYLGMAIFGSIHEFGHGLYESQVDPALERTLLARGCSLALHESQSRFWENMIGRSRPYAGSLLNHLQLAFPAQFANASPEDLYRAVNSMHPSTIRVEADELTYGFHIILRYELERDLFEGKIRLEDLPEAWNAKMAAYLDVQAPNDAEGVLQDVHWSFGGFGYFATYLLGSVLAVQIHQRMDDGLGGVDQLVAAGDFAPVRAWLGENLHRHGRKFTPRQTVQLVTGGEIDPRPYVRYLTAKVKDLYGV